MGGAKSVKCYFNRYTFFNSHLNFKGLTVTGNSHKQYSILKVSSRLSERTREVKVNN